MAIFTLFSGIVLTLVFNALIKNWVEDFELRQAALLLQSSKKTSPYLKNQFESSKKIKVLIVPGHDKESVGAEFNGVKETDLTAMTGRFLFELFKNDDKFEVFLTRDENGYSKEFASYFRQKREEIIFFRDTIKNFMKLAFDVGVLKKEVKVEHSSVYQDMSIKLYGINKWANENDIDLVLHLHFNDYPGHGYNQIGRYSGFSIYVPEKQLPNHKASVDIAKIISAKMKKYFSSSDYPPESEAVIEDQELIALGANGSLDSPALLIEYGYIYESQFIDDSLSELVLRELALQTYAGVNQYFNREVLSESGFGTFLLPHVWNDEVGEGSRSGDVLALQAALIQEGVYPPRGRDIKECPLTGSFKKCTQKAVADFQEKYHDEILAPLNLISGSGFVGQATLKKLNELYGK